MQTFVGAPPGQMQVQWMPSPGSIPGVPPGLEYLSQLDQVLIHQQVELLEAFTGFETENKYIVANSLGQQMFFATELSGCLERQCCGPVRSFEMQLLDNANREVIHLARPYRCNCCWCCCYRQEMDVQVPVGVSVGSVRQRCSPLKPEFDICGADGECQLQIIGPVCQCAPCGDVIFNVLTTSGQKIGEVRKQWTGVVKEMFTDADNFGVTFPKDLAVTTKVTLMAAAFLIDFMFFENNQNKNHHHH